MDITKLLTEAVERFPSKVQAAKALEVSRQTLDHWLGGLYVPDPWDHSRKIAEFLNSQGIEVEEADVALALLERKGISPELLRRIGERAKGVSLSSLSRLFDSLATAA